ncbi:hypothetical protein [Streptomyces acidicola]|uniref:hypothetical protein n=1 Tax=Streptomyces acidicola TaxID=2596892 RepID=UPI0037F8A3F7
MRKSLEDSKFEPGAADFSYGEMEMRRLDPSRPRDERSLITAYWALSGYGLRAPCALVWLLATMTVTVLAMMLWELPQQDPEPHSTGIKCMRQDDACRAQGSSTKRARAAVSAFRTFVSDREARDVGPGCARPAWYLGWNTFPPTTSIGGLEVPMTKQLSAATGVKH